MNSINILNAMACMLFLLGAGLNSYSGNYGAALVDAVLFVGVTIEGSNYRKEIK